MSRTSLAMNGGRVHYEEDGREAVEPWRSVTGCERSGVAGRWSSSGTWNLQSTEEEENRGEMKTFVFLTTFFP